MAADETLVRTITERVMAKVQSQITGMQDKIAKLEEKVEIETNKRIQLEEEIKKIRAEHPPHPTQRVFLRNYAYTQGGGGGGGAGDREVVEKESDGCSAKGTRNSRTQSDVSHLLHPDHLFSSTTTSQPITQPKQPTTTQPEAPSSSNSKVTILLFDQHLSLPFFPLLCAVTSYILSSYMHLP